MLKEEQIRKAIAGANQRVDWMTLDKNITFDDLGIDSLDQFDIIIAVQEASGREIPDEDISDLNSIATIEAYYAGK